MGLLSKILGRNRADMKDAARIYQSVMRQSRRPEFFGEGYFVDNYDGRIDVLTLNLSLIMKRLRDFDKNGQLLSQAVYDTMRDDFEISLREEGLSDKGVATRIKPMIRLFYDRLKAYDAVIGTDDLPQVLGEKMNIDIETPHVASIALYADSFYVALKDMTLGDIAQAKFTFPALEK